MFQIPADQQNKIATGRLGKRKMGVGNFTRNTEEEPVTA
jgi:hypothetical protein